MKTPNDLGQRNEEVFSPGRSGDRVRRLTRKAESALRQCLVAGFTQHRHADDDVPVSVMLNTPAATEVVLKIGQFHFGGGQTKIRTLLGSCVSITMWHPQLKVGGMCHYMLPQRGMGGTASAAVEGNYADEVMQMFLRELRSTGTQPKDYIVKLFGGGCMFVDANDVHRPLTDVREVSARNIAAGRALLASHGFTISAEHTGGYGSRELVFELWSGDVWIRRGLAVGTGAPA